MSITIIVIVILAIIGFSIYNKLIQCRNKMEFTWAQIDVMLKKRFDLIPNLVETVKGYATHEREVLENVTKARNMSAASTGVAEQATADNMISGALKSLFAVAENYPNLKANENFIMLQNELSDIETKIAYQRQFFNDAVFAYNTLIQVFPSNIIAKLFNFKENEYFKTELAEEREPVPVKF